MENHQLSLIKPDGRTPDGNLLPEVRDRVLREVRGYLKQTGYLNVSEIAMKLGLSRLTTKKLIDEILRAWNDEIRNEFITQIQWYQTVLKDIQEHPETYSKERIQLIKLQSSLLSKVNALRKGIIIKK